MSLKKNSIYDFHPEHLEWDLEKKIDKINELFSNALKGSNKPVLLFSGGSDSLLLLAFILRHRPEVDVIYVDMRMNFPQFDEFFTQKIRPLIKNLHYCPIDYSEEEFVKNFGIPIYPGIEEIGYDKNKFEKMGINSKCSELKDEIMKKEFFRLKPDLTIMGFLASDKPKRYNRVLEKGYLQKGPNENLFLPLAMLKKEEIFEVLEKLDFPYLRETYFNNKNGMLHKGDGVCWMCSAKCFNRPEIGNWKLLRDNYPELWEKLVNKYGLKSKLIELEKKTGNKIFREILDYYF